MVQYRDSIIFDLSTKHRHHLKNRWSTHVSSVVGEHGQILSAISLADSAGAEKMMAEHLSHSMNRYRAILDEADGVDAELSEPLPEAPSVARRLLRRPSL